MRRIAAWCAGVESHPLRQIVVMADPRTRPFRLSRQNLCSGCSGMNSPQGDRRSRSPRRGRTPGRTLAEPRPRARRRVSCRSATSRRRSRRQSVKPRPDAAGTESRRRLRGPGLSVLRGRPVSRGRLAKARTDERSQIGPAASLTIGSGNGVRSCRASSHTRCFDTPRILAVSVVPTISGKVGRSRSRSTSACLAASARVTSRLRSGRRGVSRASTRIAFSIAVPAAGALIDNVAA